MQCFYNNTQFVEPKSSPSPLAQQTIALEDQELLFLAGLNGNAIGINATNLDGIKQGEQHQWDHQPSVSFISNMLERSNIT